MHSYSLTDIITCGLISSLISTLATIVVKYLLDNRSAQKAYRRELRKQVFQRKTDVVEKAMSWYQETVDMYSLFQMAIKEYDGSANPVTVGKIQYVGNQAFRLFQETSTKLNPMYLYYDFTDIEARYDVARSANVMNDAFVLIGEIQQYIEPIPIIQEKDFETRNRWFNHLKETLDIAASAMDNQKCAIVEMQQRLREEYQQYMK